MRSFTLNFWPGLVLAVVLRVGLGFTIFIYSLVYGSNFQHGFACGLGLAAALNGAVKLYKELRG